MIPLPKLLNSSNQEVRRIRPIDVSVNEKIVPLSYASMQLAENESIPVLSYIELFTPNGSAGVFRTKTRPSAYGDAMPTVELEHAITEVGDYLVREDIESEMTLAQAITKLFGHYRGNKWQFASVSSTTKVIVDTDYEPVLTAILNVLEQVPQYYLAFNFNTTPWTVSLAQRGTTVSAEGRLCRNVRSAVVTPDESEFCTRVYLEGLPKVSGQGEIGYIDADTKSTYGIKERRLSGSGDLTSDQANRKATAYLNSHKHPKLGISISGEDFSSITGETLDRVAIGKLYRLAVPEYDTTVEENITGIGWNSVYNNPLDVTIELAEEEDKLIEFLRKQSSNESNTAKSSYRSGKRNAAAISQAQTHWEQSVQGVVDEDGNITAASIALSINQSTGESEAKIDAQKVYIGNDKSTTVIAGKCQLSDVNASYIQSQIADLSVLNVAAISATGNIHTSNGYISAPYFYIGSGSSLQNMASGIWALQITSSGNTYTLQKKDWDDSGWVDVGSFSRAVASWTMGWSSGIFTATANPQSQSASTTITQGTPSWDGTDVTIPIMGEDSDNPGYSYSTGRNVLVSVAGKLETKSVSGAYAGMTLTPGEGKIGFSSVTIGALTEYKISESWGTGNESNKLIISRASTGSTSITHTITAEANVSFNSSTNKFHATAKAKVDGTEKDNDSDDSGVISIALNSMQGSGASAYRTASVKNGSTAIVTSGNITDYGDGYTEGYNAGWNAACALISRSGNSIIGPVTGKATATSGRTETKYTANYTASKHSYTPSSYTAAKHSYTASQHSYTQAKCTTGTLEHTTDFTYSSYNGSVKFVQAKDSYTASKHSYTPASYTAESHSYTASSFSWS